MCLQSRYRGLELSTVQPWVISVIFLILGKKVFMVLMMKRHKRSCVVLYIFEDRQYKGTGAADQTEITEKHGLRRNS